MHVPERRRKPRISAALDAQLDGHTAPVRVRDISVSGVRCETDHPLPLMTQVQLVLVIPARSADGGDTGLTHQIVCRGAVVRSEPVVATGPTTAGEVGGAETNAPTADRRTGQGAPGRGGRGSRYDTAIFFTNMKDSDRIDVEEMVSAAMRAG